MDILTIILRTVRETIQASGAPPDALQEALDAAERRLRSSLGGHMHHVSRAPQITTKAKIIDLSAALDAPQIASRLGVTDRYVRKVLQQLRRVDP